MNSAELEFPDFIKEVIAEYNLVVEEVLRNGPRYWVGLMRQDNNRLILKAVLVDEIWESPRTRKQFSTSDQLRAEIMALRELGKLENQLEGGIPQLIASSQSPHVWTLREIVSGTDMSATTGSLIFRSEFYDTVRPAQLIDYILSYQRLTPQIYDKLILTPKTDQTDLISKMIMGDLDNPQEQLRPFSAAVNSYLREQAAWHDSHRTVLAHGEVYPPHIICEGGGITLIDWENIGLNIPMTDFVVPWMRAFDSPEWQSEFTRELWDREWEDKEAMRRLWDVELLRQSASKLNYLYWSKIETATQKATAAASFIQNIKEILGRNA